MTLTTHGVIGAATASLFPGNYALAWGVAFLSHFAMDAIPHWDYKTRSMKRELNPLDSDFEVSRKSLIDLVKIGVDFTLGLALGYLLFPSALHDPLLVLGGAFFGILPDPLQFVYWKTRSEPFTSLQKLHIAIHAKHRIRNWRIGIPIQLGVIGLGVLIPRLIFGF
jgi:hypothetical protein